MSTSRKLWWWVGSVSVLAVAILLAWVWWIPAAVSARASAVMSERLGLRVTVERAHVRLASVVLERLRVASTVDDALNTQVGSVELQTGFLGWLLRGASSVARVEVDGVFAQGSLATQPERAEWARLRAALSGERGARTGGGGTSREFRVNDFSMTLRDARGEILSVESASLSRESNATSLTAHQIRLGKEPYDALTMRDVRVRFVSENGRTALDEVRVAEADARWVSRDGASNRDDNTMLRLLDAAHIVASRSERGAVPVVAPPEVSAGGARSRALGLLSERGSIHVDRMNVILHSDARDETIMRDLRASAEAMPGHRIRTQGEGTASERGRVHWSLSVAPEDLQAEGTISFEALPLALVTPFLPDVPWFEPEASQLDGDLSIRATGAERLAIEGNVHVANAGIFSPRIAPEPVRNISFTIGGRGSFDSRTRRLEIASSRIDVGTANATLVGAVEWAADHYMFDLRTSMPETPCGAAIGAIPRDLLQDAAGFSWSGTMSADARVWVDSRALTGTQVEVHVADNCQFETVPSFAELARFDAPFVHQVLEPDGVVFQMETGPGSSSWTPILRMSPFFVHAVLAHEDAGFFRHHGFAPAEFQIALARNLEARRYVQGASTITMQLIKNVFLHREKTLARKAQELLLTWWIERTWDKTRILELYLNVIEYGPSIYGIRNASLHYFGCEPQDLTPAQASFLANILPNPKLFHPMYEASALTPHFAERMRYLLRRMQNRGRIDEAALQDGIDEIATFRFYHEGDSPTAVRPRVGSASDLPLTSGGAPLPWTPWEDDPGLGYSADPASTDLPSPDDASPDSTELEPTE